MPRPTPSSPLTAVNAPPASFALASLALAMLLSSLGTSIANVALPTFARELGVSFQAVQWVVLAYLLSVTTLVVSVGRLGDLFGRRRLMLGGIALFTLASIACAASSELWMLVAARTVQGCGAAVMMALSMSLVAAAAPEARAGRAMGVLGTVSAAGTALGPSLGGVLIQFLGWPSIFLINVPLGMAAYALAHRHLPHDVVGIKRPSFDLIGSALLAMTLVTYAATMTVGRGISARVAIFMLLVAACGASLFVIVESRVRSPLVQPQVFRNRVLSSGFAMSALVSTVAMTTLVVGPFHLSNALGLTPATVGLVMTAGPLVAVLVGVPAGRGVDRFGARTMTCVGLIAMTTGCLVLALIPLSAGVAGYVLPLVITTAGFATFQAANNTAVMACTEPGQRGVVSGLLNLARNLGLITGASAMGAIFAFAAGTTHLASAQASSVVTGTHAAFGVAALLTGIALLLAVTASRHRHW